MAGDSTNNPPNVLVSGEVPGEPYGSGSERTFNVGVVLQGFFHTHIYLRSFRQSTGIDIDGWRDKIYHIITTS